MNLHIDVTQIRDLGKKMFSVLDMSSFPVGVRLLPEGVEYPGQTERLTLHRYCQALMRARRGKNVTLDKEGISCPAAAAAFGFRPLPEAIRSGKALVGFGIVSDAAIGGKMLANMPRLHPGEIQCLHLFPLDKADHMPDVIVVEDEVEKLMWIVLSYLHATGGQRVHSSTAVLQATCVDSTIIPFLEDRLNFGYGCYGCRDATDIETNETVIGFPAFLLPAIVKHLEYLSRKAIPNARSKKAYTAFQIADFKRGKGCE